MFEFEVDGRGIDFGLCVSSGQVFRWRLVDGVWFGSIGSARFEVATSPPSPLSIDAERGDHGKLVTSPPSPLSTHAERGNQLVVRSSVDMEQFGGIFGLDRDDAGWFGEILVADPGLMGPVESCRGLRMIRQDNPVEVLFSFLCSANNHVRRIEVMVRHLAGYGHDGGFPDLATLARIEAVDLRRAGFGYRAERVPACAQKVLEFGGLSWLEGLKGRNAETAILELQRLPGVGPKVAECVALFGLGHLGVVPVDTHIWNAVRRRYLPDLDGSLTLARRRLVGDVMRDRFGSEAGFAHLVLFVDEMQNWRSRRRS